MTRARPVTNGTVLLAILVLVVAAAAGGCASRPVATPRAEQPPDIQAVRQVFNARVANIDRLWAESTVRVRGTDAAGEPFREQAEGFLIFIRPRQMALIVTKLGETYFYLGSDDTRFWWIDVEHSQAVVGRHDEDDWTRAADFGIPVHPLDLLDLLAVTPLPDDAPATAWSPDGKYVQARSPVRSGERVLWLDPATLRPEHVRIVDHAGAAILSARHEAYGSVALRYSGDPYPALATRIRIDRPVATATPGGAPSGGADGMPTEIILGLGRLENRGKDTPARGFDLEQLLARHRIRDVRRLADLAAHHSGAGPPAPGARP